jgi:heptosyltransferase-3
LQKNKITNILLLSYRGGYGDCLLTIALIKYLLIEKNIRIDIFTEPQFKIFFENLKYVNNIFLYNNPSNKSKLARYIELFKKAVLLRKTKYDIVLNNVGDFRHNFFGWLIKGKENISIHFNRHPFKNFIKPGFECLVSKYIYIPNDIINLYDIQKYIAEHILQTKLTLPKKREKNSRTKIAIHPMAGVKCKFWEYKNWIDLIEKLYKNDKIIVFCSPNEKVEVEAAFVAVADKVEIVAKEIQVFLKKFEKVRVFIGLDSFSIHAAYYKNVPHKIMLNGANDAKIWAPPDTKVVEVKHKCEYHPCYNKPKCLGKSFEYICIKAITVQNVLDVLDSRSVGQERFI